MKTNYMESIPSADNEQDIIKSAMFIAIESSKLLEEALHYKSLNVDSTSALIRKALNIKSKLESLINTIPNIDYLSYVSNPIDENLKKKEKDILEKSRTNASAKFNNRQLDDGGMAPPKPWEINLNSSKKSSLVEEMRKMKKQGQVITKSNYHHKANLSFEEFIEPFKYIEDTHDYNGSFLVELLKTEKDIDNQSIIYQTDITSDKQKCINGERLILSIYDLIGNPSKNEEKKFLVVLYFDKLRGTIKYNNIIFMDGKDLNLSERQKVEMGKFCKSKKIII